MVVLLLVLTVSGWILCVVTLLHSVAVVDVLRHGKDADTMVMIQKCIVIKMQS